MYTAICIYIYCRHLSINIYFNYDKGIVLLFSKYKATATYIIIIINITTRWYTEINI